MGRVGGGEGEGGGGEGGSLRWPAECFMHQHQNQQSHTLLALAHRMRVGERASAKGVQSASVGEMVWYVEMDAR